MTPTPTPPPTQHVEMKVATGEFPKVGMFDRNVETFENYVSRYKLYETLANIPTEKRVAMFITIAGPSIFALASSLLAPTDVASADYDTMIGLLKEHFKPKTIVIFERFKFYQCNQEQGETIADFVARLRKLARSCDFGSFLDQALRDRFVMGISNSSSQQLLLTEEDLSLERAVKLASAREAALRDSRDAKHGVDPDNVNRIKGSSSGNRSNFSNPDSSGGGRKKNKNYSKGRGAKGPCYNCGGDHFKRDCPRPKIKCQLCHEYGHGAKDCRNKSQETKKRQANAISSVGAQPTQDACSYENVYSFEGKAGVLRYDLLVLDANVPAELDTGTFHSLMSESTYRATWGLPGRPPLKKFEGKLAAYGGTPINVIGCLSVPVRLTRGVDPVSADFVVVKEEGPTLIGRKMMQALKLFVQREEVNAISTISKFVEKYPELFSPGLGTFQGEKFKIEVDASVPPKYCKARPVPYAMRDKVVKEIERLISEGICEPVSHSRWASGLVPVLKKDGSLRLCGDYKPVNKAVLLDRYPIPKVQDILSGLAEASVFSKLDCAQAYNQLLLDEESKELTTVNTLKGLIRWNRLAFGISSAPGIFQRCMENLFSDFPNVFCFLDDILLISKNQKEHEILLNKVFKRLEAKGIKLRADKCAIGVPEVEYLGFKITKEGLLPTSKKVDAIRNAPKPVDITSLRAFLGLLNFYRKFIPKAATVLEPLNRLLKANTPWTWGREQEEAFRSSKELLVNSEALVHFDPTLPIKVSADSSSYGIGAVLCHEIDNMERPVYFVSRTLTETERRYSQVEKEALALVYGVTSFHDYLWGQKFELITDHKPLLGLFSADKPISVQASGRIQRWGLILQAYNFDLRHKSGKLLYAADALSRLPSVKTCENTPIPADWTMLVNFLEGTPTTCANIRQETAKDPTLSKVFKYTESGWPSSSPKDAALASFWGKREELSLQDGCVLWGTRVVVPPKLRQFILDELHADHAGSSRMKELARSYVWWPKLDDDLEKLCSSCEVCLEHRPSPHRAELHPWEWPTSPWHRIHVDYAGPVDGHYFLVVVDAHSKWVDIYKTRGTTTAETVRCLQHSFSMFGLPVSLVSDNGPCFSSSEFKEFVVKCGVRHITSAAYHPSTNGQAERMVQTFKRALKKSKEPLQQTLDRFLFNYRLTPHSTTGVAPAELMFGRRPRTRLDLLRPNSVATESLVPDPVVSSKVKTKQEAQKRFHCTQPRKLDLEPESPVMIRNYGKYGAKWLPATVVERTGPVSYRCQLQDGRVFRRHQDQIQVRQESPSPVPPEMSYPTPTAVGAASASLGASPERPSSPTRTLPRRSGRVRGPPVRFGNPVSH